MTSSAARVRAMLSARSVAVVGASDRPESFGRRLTLEALRSPGIERVHLVHPTRTSVLDLPCVPSLADVPEPVDLVMCGVPDKAVASTLALASERGDGGRRDVRAAVRLQGRRGRGRRRHGAGRRRVHGVRQHRHRRPRDRLPGARPAAGRADRAGHPLRLGLLRHPADPPRARLDPRGLVGPGAGHHHAGLPRVRPLPARDPGGRAGDGDDARREAVGGLPRRRGRARHPGLRPDRRASPRAGRRWSTPTPVPSRGRTRAGRRCSRRTACTGASTWTTSPTASSCSRSDAGRVRGTGRGIVTAHDSGAERVLVADLAEGLDVQLRAAGRVDRRAARGAARPGPDPDEPARRVGSGQRHGRAVHRVPRGDGRGPGHGRGRARGRPRRGVRRRRELPGGDGEPPGSHRQAARRAHQPHLGHLAGLRRAAPRSGHPGARGHRVRSPRARAPHGRAAAAAAGGHRRRGPAVTLGGAALGRRRPRDDGVGLAAG